MVKNKLVRNAVAVVVALGVIGTIPVFAESYDMEDGHAYNNATSSGGIKCCDAGTINDRSGEYASLYTCHINRNGDCNAHSNPLYDIGNLNPLHSESLLSST